MIKLFPSLCFNLEYYESGVGFAGCLNGEDGDMTHEDYDFEKWSREHHPEWYEDEEAASTDPPR